jgi:hypothetical protein
MRGSERVSVRLWRGIRGRSRGGAGGPALGWWMWAAIGIEQDWDFEPDLLTRSLDVTIFF